MDLNKLGKYVEKLRDEIHEHGTVTLTREEAIDIWYYLRLFKGMKTLMELGTEDAAEEYAAENFSFYDKQETLDDYYALKEAFKAGAAHPMEATLGDGVLILKNEKGEEVTIGLDQLGTAEYIPMFPKYLQ